MTREELIIHCKREIKYSSIESKTYQEHRLILEAIEDQKKYEDLIIKTHDLLIETRKHYNKIEVLYNKEYREEKKELLKAELIRLDERIEVYKEILK